MVGRTVANILFAIYGDIFIEMRSVEIICGGYRLTYCIVYIYYIVRWVCNRQYFCPKRLPEKMPFLKSLCRIYQPPHLFKIINHLAMLKFL